MTRRHETAKGAAKGAGKTPRRRVTPAVAPKGAVEGIKRKEAIAAFRAVPDCGPRMSHYLVDVLGFSSPADLREHDPRELNDRLAERCGRRMCCSNVTFFRYMKWFGSTPPAKRAPELCHWNLWTEVRVAERRKKQH